jgi:microcin C transport system substrate-binding protein
LGESSTAKGGVSLQLPLYLRRFMRSKIIYLISFILLISVGSLWIWSGYKKAQSLPTEMEKPGMEETPPELGGPGFQGDEWENNKDAKSFGDPNAVKGGALRVRIPSFPLTLRGVGKDTSSRINSVLQGLLYETLLKLHPTTLEYIPSLATHWQILRDQKTFRFRLNPNARWADGAPVTTEDVVASWHLRVDIGIESPDTNKLYQKLEKPVAESKYIVHVTSKELNWQLFFHFAANMHIYPAHVLKNLDGKAYLQKYNKTPLPGSGPYELLASSLEAGRKIVLSRRNNYWANKGKFIARLYNLDRIELIAEPNSDRAFESFKKGETDVFAVYVSRQWIKELEFPGVKRGLIQKRKVFNKAPQGFSGLAFNLRHPPLDDIRVRESLVYLFHREKLIADFFLNEYMPLDSYFSGSVYANPNSPRYRYNPQKALELLKEAGWVNKTKEGWLTKDGKILELVLLCPPTLESFLKIYQEDLKKAGIKLVIESKVPDILQPIMRQQFQMGLLSWTGDHFPDPETMWDSSMADKLHSFNICGVKLSTVDKICQAYRRMFLQRQRMDALRKIDYLLMKHHPYALGWGKNYERIAYWNKFGYPEGHLTKTGDFWDILSLWWRDEAKEKKLQEALSNEKMQLPIGITEQKYWLEEK